MLSAFSVEHCPPSWWNTVRHQRGIVSAIAWNTQVDESGLDVERAVQAAPEARLVHVTPAHQAPTGAVLALPRRQHLLDWASATGAWVFEDDYDSEYRYAGRPIPALHGLDVHGQVLHVASFGKTMFPGLRLGYLVLPTRLVERFAAARANVDRFPSVLHQAAMAGFLSDGHYARHLRRMRLLYASRYEALRESLHQHASDLIELPAVPAGLETVVWLPDGLDDSAAANRLAEKGIRVEPISKSRVHRAGRPGLVLGFAAWDPSAMDKAVKVMSGLLRAML
ncbi:PLP-dependent aminotransferase family protein [Ideonella dechloratans]|uniref:PLP-dependent aminotransferase family protein n=2 Tax=Ideonella dechloratans TaxID=36863 RepID=A0A643FEP5_IDEDE|nr:PLP-dependent aminotransferase family protein [Ideonella dechloratans]KAB0583887.1 PLP-dependent aminotransferase family protein [Ideonella dechloratans]UFU12011.1 PLP-dependent aminotransferase family protein [Ideonella dechloratans]